MTTPGENLDELLDRVAAGRLGDLTPEQVAALETHLNTTPGAAERLADIVPEADPRLSVIAPTPTDADWGEVWRRVDSAALTRESTARVIGRTIRLWQPLAAAAACLLLMILWRVAPLRTEPAWELRLSGSVVVHELEIFGGDSAFVAYSDDDGSAVIWVFEEDESQGGA